MKKLWQKNDYQLNKEIESYTVGADYILDNQLLLYDIQASIAHVYGLEKIEILTKKETRVIVKTLKQINNDWMMGKIKIKVANEDCHTVIENILTKKLGDLGKKIHTGRSRNDQVLVALRLYMKNNLKEINDLTIKLAKTLLSKAYQFTSVPFPGYSHTQQAMISSVAHYYASFLESLCDDTKFLLKVREQLDKNPLGSAAGFGVNLPIDRNLTTKILKFKQTQNNSLYCQNSKGKFESIFLEAIAQVMMTVGKMADDMIIFTAQEFSFFKIDNSITTGSSIMPQKKNLDVLEIIRGNISVIFANQLLVKELNKNTFSGYNRDTQLMKKPLFESVEIVKNTLKVMNIFLKNIQPDQDQIVKKIKNNILMADMALELVQKNKIPFRKAYIQATKITTLKNIDYSKEISKKISAGSAGNLKLEMYKKIIDKMEKID